VYANDATDHSRVRGAEWCGSIAARSALRKDRLERPTGLSDSLLSGDPTDARSPVSPAL